MITSVRVEMLLLTAVVVDKLLQCGKLCARCDVEAAAVQLPDLVVLYVEPFGVVVVQHRQTVGTWRVERQRGQCMT